MSPITCIGIRSLSLKIWFRSVAAETHYHKKDGSSGAGPGAETRSPPAAPLAHTAWLRASVSPRLRETKPPSALQTSRGRAPGPCPPVPRPKHPSDGLDEAGSFAPDYRWTDTRSAARTGTATGAKAGPDASAPARPAGSGDKLRGCPSPVLPGQSFRTAPARTAGGARTRSAWNSAGCGMRATEGRPFVGAAARPGSDGRSSCPPPQAGGAWPGEGEAGFFPLP